MGSSRNAIFMDSGGNVGSRRILAEIAEPYLFLRVSGFEIPNIVDNERTNGRR